MPDAAIHFARLATCLKPSSVLPSSLSGAKRRPEDPGNESLIVYVSFLMVHTVLSSASVIARYEAIQDNKGAMFCLCLRQSGLWILDVALPVGSALKDDGNVGKCVLVESPVRWIASSLRSSQ
jgi:hypothetical protein